LMNSGMFAWKDRKAKRVVVRSVICDNRWSDMSSRQHKSEINYWDCLYVSRWEMADTIYYHIPRFWIPLQPFEKCPAHVDVTFIWKHLEIKRQCYW
jgi:hypothetical protein